MTPDGFSIYQQLLRVDLDALRAHQAFELRRLLRELERSNAFYRARMDGSQSASAARELDDMLRQLPLLHKHELVEDQQAYPPFGRNHTCGIDEFVRFHQTSGTSGEPLHWPDSQRNWRGFLDSWELVLRSAGLAAHDRIYVAFSFGPFIGFWGAFEAAQRMGALALSGGAQTSEQRVTQMVALGATALVCTPTYALRLAEVASELGVDLAESTLRTTLHAGEPGASLPSTRKRLEQAFAASCFDHAGATEVGAWGYSAPDGLFVDEQRFLAELREPKTGTLLEIGEKPVRGELVLTTLARPDRPVLRYCTGDLVEASRPGLTASGSARDVRLYLHGGVLGRVDEMITVRGVNVYPSAVEALVRRLPQIIEYRATVVEHRGMCELELEVEPAPAYDTAQHDALSQRLAALFREHLHLRVPIAIVAPGSLPRFELKAKRFVRRAREAP